MVMATRRQARPVGNQDGALCAVYMVAPTTQMTKTSTHSPPETPLRGSGLAVMDQNRISASRMTPQAISRKGQNREMRSTSGIYGKRLRHKNSTPSPIRISGPITEPRLISRYLRVADCPGIAEQVSRPRAPEVSERRRR